MIIKFEWDGEHFEYDPNNVDMATGIEIKERTGMGMRTVGREFDDINPIAVQAVFFACQRQNGNRSLQLSQCVVAPMAFHRVFEKAAQEAMREDISSAAEAGIAEKMKTSQEGVVKKPAQKKAKASTKASSRTRTSKS